MIIEKIKEAIQARGITINSVATSAGIDPGNLSRFLSGKQSMSSGKLENIFRVLNIELKVK